MTNIKMLVLMFALTSEVIAASEFSETNNIESIPNYLNQTNLQNVSPTCNLEIDQLFLKRILNLMHHKKANAIALNVWIESVNNPWKKIQITPAINLANEMGRTLISVISQAEAINGTPVLSSYTTTLTPGVDNMDVVIFDTTGRCLLLLDSKQFEIVVNFLIYQLYQLDRNGEGSDYQLCVKHITTVSDGSETKYNCCNLFERKNMLICSDYSSILLESYNGLLVGAMYIFLLFAFPKIVEYIRCYQKECVQYKISDSPMSVSSIFHTIFIEGHGPIMSFGRRLVIAAIIVLTTLPRYFNLVIYIFVCLWGLLFPFFNAYHFDQDFTIVIIIKPNVTNHYISWLSVEIRLRLLPFHLT